MEQPTVCNSTARGGVILYALCARSCVARMRRESGLYFSRLTHALTSDVTTADRSTAYAAVVTSVCFKLARRAREPPPVSRNLLTSGPE